MHYYFLLNLSGSDAYVSLFLMARLLYLRTIIFHQRFQLDVYALLFLTRYIVYNQKYTFLASHLVYILTIRPCKVCYAYMLLFLLHYNFSVDHYLTCVISSHLLLFFLTLLIFHTSLFLILQF